MDNVKDVVVLGEKNPITGNVVAARFNLFEPEDLAAFKKRVRAFCRDRLATYKIPARIEIIEREQFNARYKRVRRAEPLA
jgi:acyl-CoA synthetase (AMP-forming)/AMP-acid ligase II